MSKEDVRFGNELILREEKRRSLFYSLALPPSANLDIRPWRSFPTDRHNFIVALKGSSRCASKACGQHTDDRISHSYLAARQHRPGIRTAAANAVVGSMRGTPSTTDAVVDVDCHVNHPGAMVRQG